jgi:type IV pilus assembly protein PilE
MIGPTARPRGFTLIEALTVAVVLAVLTAIAVPTWRTHLLRVQRADATAALLAVQSAQDRYFGQNARYAAGSELTTAPPRGLGLGTASAGGRYRLHLETAADGLSYSATARTVPDAGQSGDTRCAELRIDHLGRRTAIDAAGQDRSGDCWR